VKLRFWNRFKIRKFKRWFTFLKLQFSWSSILFMAQIVVYSLVNRSHPSIVEDTFSSKSFL
jgi:hypothetical protein